MRAKTVKRSVILITVIALLGIGAFFLWNFQVGKMAKGVVEQADQAFEKQDYDQALDLYQQHLLVVPNDQIVQLKFADALLKRKPSTKGDQETAMAIFKEILTRDPGRSDVRRQAAVLALQMTPPNIDIAQAYLKILADAAKDDGDLDFMQGQCYELEKEPQEAFNKYNAAIKHGTTKRIPAFKGLAKLIRENPKLGKPEEADQKIDEMVKADPGNYQVYLERGRYRRNFNLPGAESDLLKALELANKEPETYYELASLAGQEKVPEEARQTLDQHRPFSMLLPRAIDVSCQIVEKGLDSVEDTNPGLANLYRLLAEVKRRASGSIDGDTEALERGVKRLPQDLNLRLQFALTLATKGDTNNLNLQIEELKNLKVDPVVIDYLNAYYNYNNKDFKKSKEILTSIQMAVSQNEFWKSRVNMLLAQCNGNLNEPTKALESIERAYSANPNDPNVRMKWIVSRVNRYLGRGQLDEAIKVYQQYYDQLIPQSRLHLVTLMLNRNLKRPPAQRDWREIEQYLADIRKQGPTSIDLIVTQASVYAAEERYGEAMKMLESAHPLFPDAVQLWTVEAEVLLAQKKYDEALSRLGTAQKQLGKDRVELRRTQARIWVARGVPKEQLLEKLNGLATNLESFEKKERRELLMTLAGQMAALEDNASAERLWLRLAEDDPQDIEPHIQLFDLALRTATNADNAKQKALKEKALVGVKAQPDIAKLDESIIKAKADMVARIKAIEPIDETRSRYCQARYLIWQSTPPLSEFEKNSSGEDNASKYAEERKKLRTEVRALLDDLKARRDDWDFIPIAKAQLEEQELAELGSDTSTKKKDLQTSIVNNYLNAIEFGVRDPFVVRRSIELLFVIGRGNEAIQLYNRMASVMQLGSDLGQQVAEKAIQQNNPQAGQTVLNAEASARRAVAANPSNFDNRLRLAQILIDSKRIDEAEAELRAAIAQSDDKPEAWAALVRILILDQRLPEAEKAFRDAEKKLALVPRPEAKLALAQCCGMIATNISGPDAKDRANKWFEEESKWFKQTLEAQKDPKKKSETLRLMVEVFIGSRRLTDAEKQLKEIISQASETKEMVAWARRTLALMYIELTNPRRLDEALALLDTAGARKQDADPEDIRVRALALKAEGTQEALSAAIASLEPLVQKVDNPIYQALLAQVYEAKGDWVRSRQEYLSLIERVSNSLNDPDRRIQIGYRSDFAERLLSTRSGQDEAERKKDLDEAERQIEKLKLLNPDLIQSLILEVELNLARDGVKNINVAHALVKAQAERTDLNPNFLPQLGAMAEKVGQVDHFELAEKIYRRSAALGSVRRFDQRKLNLLRFLAQHRTIKDTLDYCEPFRQSVEDRYNVDQACIRFFADPSIPFNIEDTKQMERFVKWLKDEIRNGGRTFAGYTLALGNIYERMDKYNDAQDTYRAIINNRDDDGAASNNLAWLMTMTDSKNGNEALKLIESAIDKGGEKPDFLDTRGVIHLVKGDVKSAVADLEKAVKSKPSAGVYFHLVQAYDKTGDKQKAERNWELAMSKGIPKDLHRLEMKTYQDLQQRYGKPRDGG